MLSRHRPSWNISLFSSGEELIEAIENQKDFDLVFLDIYMDKLNGMETAIALRNMSCLTALVFLTSSRDFAVESYQVEALSYLVKPLEEKSFLELLNRFEIQYRPKQIRLGNQMLPVSEILYFESQDKKVLAYLQSGQVVEWTSKLDSVATYLAEKSFLRCHRSFLVNMDAISRVFGNKFLLTQGTEIPIRRQDVSELTETYYKYITS